MPFFCQGLSAKLRAKGFYWNRLIVHFAEKRISVRSNREESCRWLKCIWKAKRKYLKTGNLSEGTELSLSSNFRVPDKFAGTFPNRVFSSFQCQHAGNATPCGIRRSCATLCILRSSPQQIAKGNLQINAKKKRHLPTMGICAGQGNGHVIR